MSNQKDIILNPDGSFKILNGDFVVDYSDGQNGQLLLLSEKGNWRRNPLVGVGLRKMQNTKLDPLTILSLKKEIRLQFTNDNYTVNSIVVPQNKPIVVDYE